MDVILFLQSSDYMGYYWYCTEFFFSKLHQNVQAVNEPVGRRVLPPDGWLFQTSRAVQCRPLTKVTRGPPAILNASAFLQAFDYYADTSELVTNAIVYVCRYFLHPILINTCKINF